MPFSRCVVLLLALQPAKKAASQKPKKAKVEVKVKAEPSSGGSSPTKRGKAKKEEEVEVWKWYVLQHHALVTFLPGGVAHAGRLCCRWEEEKQNDGKKWHTLEHRGPVFAPAYEPLPDNVRFFYDGEPPTPEPATRVAQL